jgi:hypothetical protein
MPTRHTHTDISIGRVSELVWPWVALFLLVTAILMRAAVP